MHEVSIAMEIAERLQDEPQKYKKRSISKVVITIGTMSGVVKEALEFALTSISSNEPFIDTVWELHEEKSVVKCNECQKESSPESPMIYCSHCISTNVEIIKGKSMIISSFDLV